jgi:hypothetical protein
MTDDNKRPDLNDNREQAKLEQANQQAPRDQASESELVPPMQRKAPGRRPLFRA